MCGRRHLTPRILVIGSGEEYGRAGESDLPLTEDHPLRPENPYSVSKVAQDVMGYQYFISYGLPVMRVRPFNHVGPGQSRRFVLPAFAGQVAEIEAGLREPILSVGNLDPARDFTDVRDVVAAYELILRRGTPGDVYNVASGRALTVQDLVDQLIALVGEPIEIRMDPERYRPADIPDHLRQRRQTAARHGLGATDSPGTHHSRRSAEWRAKVKSGRPRRKA